MAKFRRIERTFGECCVAWGYREIRTPVVEYLHLFTSAGTLSPDMLGRVYTFLDWDGWSGERVVLRPDGTIPAARLYVENFQDDSIARFYYAENVFAFESSGDEPRERWQCGAELIGGSKLEGDVELMSLALEAIDKLGIGPVEVRVAHAGVLKTFLEELGLAGEQEAEVLDQVFAGNRDVLGAMRDKNPEVVRQLELLFGLKGSSPGFVENLKGTLSSSLPALEPSLDQLARIAGLLSGSGYSYQIDFTTGRGFEYYTGIIFGFHCQDRRLGGGGRYDELIPLVGGQDVCASGFALYIDELMDLIEETAQKERILIRAKDGDGLKSSLEVARSLREAGHVAEFDLGYRETSGFRWIVDLRRGEGIEVVDQGLGEKQLVSSIEELSKVMEEAACR
jgi:histidyl-tRNA synthetase